MICLSPEYLCRRAFDLQSINVIFDDCHSCLRHKSGWRSLHDIAPMADDAGSIPMASVSRPILWSRLKERLCQVEMRWPFAQIIEAMSR